MRLTLRTLLAYLDDVLEPSQTKELGEKINESGFAANLMAKIKDVMRRRRLSAPALSGPGAGIDCNIVGEYLDSTLAPDKVADVEKICLESDVHLAEVAACHQVLTLVLHEPVEISPEAKARLYALTPDGGAIHPQVAVPEFAAPVAEAPLLDRPSKVTGVKALDTPPAEINFVVPEQPLAEITSHPIAAPATPEAALPSYLREEPRNNRWMKYVVGLIIAFAWGVLMVKYGPFGAKEDATSSSNSSDTKRTIKNVDVAQNDKTPKVIVVPEDEPRVPVLEKKDAGDPDLKAESPEKVPVPAQNKIGIPPKEPLKTETVPAGDSTKSTKDVPSKDAEKVVVVETKPLPKKTDAEMTPKADDPKSTDPKTATPVEVATVKPETPETLPPAPPQAAILAPAAAIYKTNDSVLLHFDKKPGGWFVLGPKAHIHPDDRLAVPEPFEATIAIDDGMLNLSLRGGTRVRMLGPTATVNGGWEVLRGKLIIRRGSEGEKSASMLLKIRQLMWRLDLLTPDTQCAIQVDPVITDRFEQDLGDRTVNAGLYVASGVLRLTRLGSGTEPGVTGEPVEIAGPGSQPLTPDVPAELVNGISRWFGPYAPTPALKNYMTFFAKKFEGDEKVELSLTGEDAKSKISLLETECLGLIGAYEPLVTILQRTPYDDVRRAAIDGLRVWLPQQPGNRKLLKLALTAKFPPDDAEIIYELLWGYNAEDLRNRVKSTSLLDWMESSHIAIRELTFQQVFRLTKKSFDYRPNSSEAQLKAAVRSWRSHLQKNGALLPPAPPAP